MKLPWVSREMYSSMLAEKDRQIAEWKDIAQKALDRFFLKATNAPLFAEVPEDKETPKPADFKDPKNMSAVERARARLGPKANARTVQRYIEKELQDEFQTERGVQDPAETFTEANEELTKALQKGRAAAMTTAN